MLTAELVLARRRGDALLVSAVAGAVREDAVACLQAVLPIFHASIGHTRAELHEALWQSPETVSRDRIRSGLIELIEAQSEFVGGDASEIEALRYQVFVAAQHYRDQLPAGAHFDRTEVLASLQSESGLSSEQIEARIFSDIRSAQRLLRVPERALEDWLNAYDVAMVQAVLLRATKLQLRFHRPEPRASRQFLQRLKFLQLCLTASWDEERHFVLEIDGPHGLFRKTTQYGHRLAQLVPLLGEFSAWQLSAEVLWGKQRRRLVFQREGGGETNQPRAEVQIRPEAHKILNDWAALQSGWQCQLAETWLTTAKNEICVPDLEFFQTPKQKFYLEILGAWSRQAFFKRVDWVAAGLDNVLFVAPEELRVKEEVVDTEALGSLYVYKRTPSAKKILAKLEQMNQRRAAT